MKRAGVQARWALLEAYLFAGRELHYDMQIDLIAEQRPEGFD